MDIHRSKKYANEYDRKIVRIIECYDDLLQETATAVPFGRTDEIKILELGYGTGNLTKLLLQTHPYSHVIGIDYSPHVEHLARTKLRKAGVPPSRLRAILADINNYAFEQHFGDIDVIIGTLIFHDLTFSERDRFFSKAFRVLRDGGAIIIGDVVGATSESYRGFFFRSWTRYLSKTMDSQEITSFFKQPEIMQMLNAGTINDHHESLARYGLDRDFDTHWKSKNFAVIVSFKQDVHHNG